MTELNRKIDQRTSEELLTLLLRSDDKAKAILKTVSIAQLDQAHRNELGITPKAFERLQASIELGRRVEEAKAHYRKKIEKICSVLPPLSFAANISNA